MPQMQSSSSAPIAVTGSTGRLGGLVARFLSDAGVSQRLLVRSPERAPQLAGVDIARFTYFDTEETRSALKEIETLFMVSAAESADRLEQHHQFIQAAAAFGVKNIVYTSFLGASENATFTLARDHGKTEDFIRATGMNFTFLRDNFYQDVFPLFATDGVIAGPAEDSKVAAVAIEDVARVATQVFQAPEKFHHQTLDLTGPEESTGKLKVFHFLPRFNATGNAEEKRVKRWFL